MTVTTATKRLAATLVVATLVFAGAVSAQARATTPFTAHFAVSKGRFGLGSATFQLRPADKSNCYVYTGHARPNKLARLFIGNITEVSRFCVVDNRIRPSFFRHHVDGEKDDSFTLTFDWSAHVVHYKSEDGDTKTMKIGAQALDPLSLQIAARRWIGRARHPASLKTRAFTLVDGDEVKPYKLAVQRAPDVSVPSGRYSVLVVKRIDNHPLKFWLAKEADWIPVRVQKTSGSGAFQMNMRRLSIEG